METAYRIAALAIVTAVLCVLLRQSSRPLALLVTLAACVGMLLLGLELLPGLLELGASVPPQAVSNETDMTAANATAAIFLDNLILMFLLFLV